MFTRFYKTEFFISLLFIIMSMITFFYGDQSGLQLVPPNFLFNIHDTYYVVSVEQLYNIWSVFSFSLGTILLVLSQKKFSSFKGIYVNLAIIYFLYMFTIIKGKMYKALPTMQNRDHTKYDIQNNDFYVNLNYILIIALVLVFITIAIVKIKSFTNTIEMKQVN